MYNITFQQIDAFLTIARYKNLSEAAEHIFISQPALSRTLRRFEESLGLTLFTRSNAGVSLTPEGEYLVSVLEPLYNNVGAIMKTAKSIRAEPQKNLNIVQAISYDAVEDYDTVRHTVQRYTQLYPNVNVTETLHDFRELRQQLEYGDADIVVSQDFALVGIPNIKRRTVSVYNMYIAISVYHPLAAFDELTPEMLRDEPLFIVPKTGTAFDRENAIMHYGQMGFTISRIEFVPNFLTLLHTLRLQKGFSICGRFLHIGVDDIKYYPISPELNTSRVVVAWRAGRLTPEAQDFIDMLPEE